MKHGELAPLTVQELESKSRIIRASFMGRRIVQIDESAVRRFLEGLPQRARGKDNICIKFSQFLNYCRRQKWLATNPAEFAKIRVPSRAVDVLTASESEHLLRNR